MRLNILSAESMFIYHKFSIFLSKKISCKIISSKPLINREEVSPDSNKQSNNYHKVNDNTAGSPQANFTHNSFTYSHSLGTVKESVNKGINGQFLDCYA